jgi:phage shock protein A
MGLGGVDRDVYEDDLESLKKQYESAREMIETLQDKIAALEAGQKEI